ncbi:group 3 secretory phospholipase A2 [Microcaecilia unicolor]|uniref:phospholipase A2 n=1 Tax=Microcaecilia unicolor TaxID=1415580 RepID=A0A6P7ZQ39_9AMPH|nr:group 3 secretory phospholipase A2 [Microcaecilia unicolor]
MTPRVLLVLWVSVLAAEPQSSLLGRDSTFCHVLRSGSGLSYLSFLHRGPDGLQLYQSTWAPGGRLQDCSVREEAELVRVYEAACAEGIRGDVSGIRQNLRELERSRHRCSRGPGVRAKRALEGAEPGTGGTRRRTKRGWTMPGTLWCGAGDSAGNFTDLGIFKGADLCCREHDHCAERLTAFEFNYGIRNYRLHTVSHCDCDYRFKKCLHDVNDTISTFVGITFFNILEVPCLMLEEKEECMEWHWWGACKNYGHGLVAEIKQQGIFNYTHPFSDELDERYRPNRTDPNPPVGGSTITNSLDAKPAGALSSDFRAERPRLDEERRRKQNENQKNSLQETGGGTAEEPELLPTEGEKDHTAGTEPGLPTTTVPKVKTGASLSETPATSEPEVPTVSLPESPGSPESKVLSNHLDELHPLTEKPPPEKKPQSSVPKNQEAQSNGSSINTGKQDIVMAGLDHPAMGQGKDRLPQPPETPPAITENKVLVNVKGEPIGNTSDGRHPSVPHGQPHKDKISQHYISKSCGCYRRLDQCEYKIAPKEMKFQLYNPDQKTLFHCNCTRRLAKFLRRTKGPNEVEDVLSDFVSPSCFTLESLVTCKREQETGTSCTSIPTAVLSNARHLQRAMKLLQKNKPLRAPGKVKRQDRRSLKLYDTCLQRLGASVGQREKVQTPPH